MLTYADVYWRIGPLPAGLPGPNPDEMVNMLNSIMIPPRFYKPPSTMSVGANLIPGTATAAANKNQGGRHGGNKRGKRDDDDAQVGCVCACAWVWVWVRVRVRVRVCL